MMANRFEINPLGGRDPNEVIRQSFQDQEARQEKQRVAAQRQQMQEAMAGAATGDVDAINNLFAINPKLGEQYENRLIERQKREGIAANDAKVEAELDWAIQYKRAVDSGDEEASVELVKAAEANPLIDFDSTMMGKDRRQDQLVVNTMLFKGLGKDQYKALIGGEGEPGKPAGQLEFEALIKDFPPEQQKTARQVKAGLKGRAMSSALLTAIKEGIIPDVAAAKKQIRESEKFGEMTAASRSKTIDKGFISIEKIDAATRNIDNAIRVLDEGAGVGAVQKLWPSIKAASVELDNIRGRMALDVVGATTFGALSAGELNLAKDVALPTGLDTAELKDYLARKKVAQEKLRAYYYEQIQFLDQGGTVAGFLRRKEEQMGQQPDAQQDQQPTQQDPQQPQAGGLVDNGDGTFTLPDGRIVRRKGG